MSETAGRMHKILSGQVEPPAESGTPDHDIASIESLVRSRVEQLAKIQPQEQLAYIAALLEYSVRLQFDSIRKTDQILEMTASMEHNATDMPKSSDDRTAGTTGDLIAVLRRDLEALAKVAPELVDHLRSIDRMTMDTALHVRDIKAQMRR